jgi:hypothetical protein
MAPLDDGRFGSGLKANVSSSKAMFKASNEAVLFDVVSLPATDAIEPERGLWY